MCTHYGRINRMTKLLKHCSALIAAVLAGSMLVAVPTVASADSVDQTVTSSRSFRKASKVSKDLLQESVSSSVDPKSNWGGVESLNVPQTQSQAEKDAAAKKAADDAAAASRSASREPLPSQSQDFTITPPDGKTSADLVNYGEQFIGKVPYVLGGNTPAGWDCSGFVQYVYAQFGISLPRVSGAQATVGRPVADLSQAMPGDIIANGSHAAIYIGNGTVVNAANPDQGTCISVVSQVFTGGYSIRRLL